MVECTCFCYVISGRDNNKKFWFVVIDKTIGEYKVPMVPVDEKVDSIEKMEDMLVTEIGKFDISIDKEKLALFDYDKGKKKINFFTKVVIPADMRKRLPICSVEELFNNIGREQFTAFIKLLNKMQESKNFVKSEIDFFEKLKNAKTDLKGQE